MLSIIIVSYNTKKLLYQCLSSLFAREYPIPIETIVVDNDSQDGSAAMVRETFTKVRLIENKENVGFSRANNMGLEIARGDYILLLNSDTKVLGDALTNLVTFLDMHPDVAVVSGRIVYPDFSDQGVARTFPTPLNAFFGRTTLLNRLFPNNRFSRKYLLSRMHTSNTPFEVDWVSGACLMVRKKVLEEVGLLDEKFFMYWEDADLCFRIKHKGWRIFCTPEAKVIHYEGKSTNRKSSNRLIIEFNKSAYRFYRKHYLRSSFEIMNFVAIFGLAFRALVMIGINMIREKEGSHNGKDAVAGSIDI